MGKPAIAKKKSGPSVHSRAARRATSPSINTDKSLKELRPPVDRPSKSSTSDGRPSVLGIHRSSGVFKKTSTRKSVLSSKQRKRRERGADMALAVAERTTQKVQESWGRAKTVMDRRKKWEDINGKIGAEMAASTAARGPGRGFAVLEDEGAAQDDSEQGEEDWEDADGDRDLIGAGDAAVTLAVSESVSISHTAPVTAADDEDEIL